MVILREATITPRGIVVARPMRLVTSSFSKSGCALANSPPWVGRPDLLSDKQLARTSALTSAAQAARGTRGVVYNPATGRMMPKICEKIAAALGGRKARK